MNCSVKTLHHARRTAGQTLGTGLVNAIKKQLELK